MIGIRPSRPDDADRVVDIWRRAVDATHDFLNAEDRSALDDLVRAHLPGAPLTLAVDADDRALAFMAIGDGHMEALFVDPAQHGRGIGSALVRHGLARHPRLTTDVNEQNAGALRFYERMGFRRIGRSPTDRDGRPYPLVHLRYEG